jgi:hypothetical protein
LQDHAPPSIPLDEPRPLNDGERALVDWLLTSPAAPPTLTGQVRLARVTEICSCGCPSIVLDVPDDAPTARLDPDHPDVRHGQDLSITAEGVAPDGRAVDVILHVIAGRVIELEIWAGTFGGDPRTDLPDPATLSFY